MVCRAMVLKLIDPAKSLAVKGLLFSRSTLIVSTVAASQAQRSSSIRDTVHFTAPNVVRYPSIAGFTERRVFIAVDSVVRQRSAFTLTPPRA